MRLHQPTRLRAQGADLAQHYTRATASCGSEFHVRLGVKIDTLKAHGDPELIMDAIMEATRLSLEEAVFEASRASLKDAGGRHGDLIQNAHYIL